MEVLRSLNFDVYHPQEYRTIEESGILANVSNGALDSDDILSIIRELRLFDSFAILTLIDCRPKHFTTNHFISLVNLLCVPEAQIPPSVRRAFISTVINEWLSREIDKSISLLLTDVPTDVTRALDTNSVPFKRVPGYVKQVGGDSQKQSKAKPRKKTKTHIFVPPVKKTPESVTSTQSSAPTNGKIKRKELLEFKNKYPKAYVILSNFLLDPGVRVNKILRRNTTPVLTRCIQSLTEQLVPLEAFIMITQIFRNHKVDLSLLDKHKKTAYDYAKQMTRGMETSEDAKKLLSILTPVKVEFPSNGLKDDKLEKKKVKPTSTIKTNDFIKPTELDELKSLDLSSQMLKDISSWTHSAPANSIGKRNTPYLTCVIQRLIRVNAPVPVFVIISQAFINHKVNITLVDGSSKTAYDYVEETLLSRGEWDSLEGQKLLSLLNPILPGFEVFAKKYSCRYSELYPTLKDHVGSPDEIFEKFLVELQKSEKESHDSY